MSITAKLTNIAETIYPTLSGISYFEKYVRIKYLNNIEERVELGTRTIQLFAGIIHGKKISASEFVSKLDFKYVESKALFVELYKEDMHIKKYPSGIIEYSEGLIERLQRENRSLHANSYNTVVDYFEHIKMFETFKDLLFEFIINIDKTKNKEEERISQILRYDFETIKRNMEGTVAYKALAAYDSSSIIEVNIITKDPKEFKSE